MGRPKKVLLDNATMEVTETGWMPMEHERIATGAKQIPDLISVELIKCKKCNSPERSILRTDTRVGFVFRRCKCSKCGQIRIEKSEEVKKKEI